jgi:type III secretory pathway component EscU
MTQYNSHRKKTNDRQYNNHRFLWLLYYQSFVFLSVAIILSVICFSFCGYYIVCHLFFFVWLLYCPSFVFLSVVIILSVICFLSVAIILCHLFFFLWLLYYQSFVFLKEKLMTDNIIATERKTNDGQYNSPRKKNK